MSSTATIHLKASDYPAGQAGYNFNHSICKVFIWFSLRGLFNPCLALLDIFSLHWYCSPHLINVEVGGSKERMKECAWMICPRYHYNWLVRIVCTGFLILSSSCWNSNFFQRFCCQTYAHCVPWFAHQYYIEILTIQAGIWWLCCLDDAYARNCISTL